MPKSSTVPLLVRRGFATYPPALAERLGDSAPEALAIFGPPTSLLKHLVALFCSQESPGATILRALDQASAWRDQGICVIGGFHSPLERECLATLLRGKQAVVIVMPRTIPSLRLDATQREAFDGGRLTILAPASGSARTTAKSSYERNRLVAALADEVVFAYIRPSGSLARLAVEIDSWGGSWRQLTW